MALDQSWFNCWWDGPSSPPPSPKPLLSLCFNAAWILTPPTSLLPAALQRPSECLGHCRHEYVARRKTASDGGLGWRRTPPAWFSALWRPGAGHHHLWPWPGEIRHIGPLSCGGGLWLGVLWIQGAHPCFCESRYREPPNYKKGIVEPVGFAWRAGFLGSITCLGRGKSQRIVFMNGDIIRLGIFPN